MMHKEKICQTTVMDSSDPNIRFDQNGICHYVEDVRQMQEKYWYPNELGKEKLDKIVSQIKKDGRGRKYDCIIGLSGGLDSSYLAFKMKKYNLRALAVHVDGGWNSETSVQNIKKICDYNAWKLFTFVVNWEEMKDLQLAYLKAGVVNQDVPQDHAFFAKLWQEAARHKVKWALSGGNIASESILPLAWRGHDAMDHVHLTSIHKKFGSKKLNTYPRVGFIKYNLDYKLLRGMKVLKPLNLMPYIRSTAIQELESKTGWKSYGDKHHESIFTKFFQGYYLPVKYGYDKRKAHLSSMILSGQMSRDMAMAELNKPSYNEDEIPFQKEYIAKKLGIHVSELEHYINSTIYNETDFNSSIKRRDQLIKLKSKASKFVSFKGQELG